MSIVPSLSNAERAEYLVAEIVKVREMLEDTGDCKWIYERLIEMVLGHVDVSGEMVGEVSWEDVEGWRAKLEELDPLRKGRWRDLGGKIEEFRQNSKS